MYLLALHPILQIFTVATVFSLFALGVKRFQQLHLERKIVFPWKRHVLLGKIAMVLVVLGYGSGITAVYNTFRVIGFTGLHHEVGEFIVPLLLVGFGTGLYMDSRKKKRKILPMLHGLTNLLVLLLFVFQAGTGMRLVILYFFGR